MKPQNKEELSKASNYNPHPGFFRRLFLNHYEICYYERGYQTGWELYRGNMQEIPEIKREKLTNLYFKGFQQARKDYKKHKRKNEKSLRKSP